MSDSAVAAIVEKPKHWAASLVDNAIGGIDKATTTKPGAAPYVDRAWSLAGVYVSANALGALLGAADATIGPEPGGVSIDGSLALLFGLGSLATAGVSPGFSAWSQTMGAATSMGWSRRKVSGMLGHGGGSTSGGGSTREPSRPRTPAEDPIVQKAKDL